MNKKNSNKATRLVASSFAKYSTDLIGQAVRKFDISIEDIAIIALVLAESTRPLREDPYLASKFGFDDRTLPKEYRLSVSLKFVHTSLGLSRETARRKLGRLVDRGFLSRINSNYVYLSQDAAFDITKVWRTSLVETIESIAAEADRARSPD